MLSSRRFGRCLFHPSQRIWNSLQLCGINHIAIHLQFFPGANLTYPLTVIIQSEDIWITWTSCGTYWPITNWPITLMISAHWIGWTRDAGSRELGKTHALCGTGDNCYEDSQTCHFGKKIECLGVEANRDIPWGLKDKLFHLASPPTKKKILPLSGLFPFHA